MIPVRSGAPRVISARNSVGRPGALRKDVAQQLEPRRALRERERVEAHAPGRNGREPVALDLRLLAALDVAQAEVEREAVVELQQLVLAAVFAEVAAELRLLLGHEGVDLILHLGRARQAEPGIEAVALPVDPGAVHRDEQAGVGVLLRDRGDARAVEGQVGRDADLEEVHRPARVVDLRRLLPDRPAVVVPLGGHDQRVVVRAPLRPGAGAWRPRRRRDRSGRRSATNRRRHGRSRRHRRQLVDVGEHLVDRDDVRVLRVQVVEVRLVRRPAAVSHRLAGDDDAIAVLHRVERRRADAT